MRSTLLLSTLLLSGAPAMAQISHGPPAGTPHECDVMIHRLGAATHSAAFRSALIAGHLHRCGAAGAGATADVMRRLADSNDPDLLKWLIVPASYNRHPAILDAALDIAGDRSAAPLARAVAFEIALRQHNVTIGFGPDLGQLLSDPPGENCIPDAIFDASYENQAPLPAGYQDRIRDVGRRIAADGGELPAIRKLAACAAHLAQGQSYEDFQRIVVQPNTATP